MDTDCATISKIPAVPPQCTIALPGDHLARSPVINGLRVVSQLGPRLQRCSGHLVGFDFWGSLLEGLLWAMLCLGPARRCFCQARATGVSGTRRDWVRHPASLLWEHRYLEQLGCPNGATGQRRAILVSFVRQGGGYLMRAEHPSEEDSS